MVGVGDRGTRTTEATADQIVVEPARADIAGVRILVVMGVSGSGKTTIAKALADRLGWAFEEGDDLHPGYLQDALRTSARRPRPVALAEVRHDGGERGGVMAIDERSVEPAAIEAEINLPCSQP
jgi:hypothetical protein